MSSSAEIHFTPVGSRLSVSSFIRIHLSLILLSLFFSRMVSLKLSSVSSGKSSYIWSESLNIFWFFYKYEVYLVLIYAEFLNLIKIGLKLTFFNRKMLDLYNAIIWFRLYKIFIHHLLENEIHRIQRFFY